MRVEIYLFVFLITYFFTCVKPNYDLYGLLPVKEASSIQSKKVGSSHQIKKKKGESMERVFQSLSSNQSQSGRHTGWFNSDVLGQRRR